MVGVRTPAHLAPGRACASCSPPSGSSSPRAAGCSPRCRCTGTPSTPSSSTGSCPRRARRRRPVARRVDHRPGERPGAGARVLPRHPAAVRALPGRRADRRRRARRPRRRAHGRRRPPGAGADGRRRRAAGCGSRPTAPTSCSPCRCRWSRPAWSAWPAARTTCCSRWAASAACVTLPSVLRRCIVRDAAVGSGELRVRFERDEELWASGR